MLAIIKTFTLSVVAIGVLVYSTHIARAGSSIALSDGQLDHITAGGVTVTAGAASTSQALWTSAQSNTTTIVGSAPGRVSGADTQGGLATGTAISNGTNFANTTAPPPSQSTSVTTGGTVGGNLVITMSNNTTLSGLGLTIQTGFTSIYGAVELGF